MNGKIYLLSFINIGVSSVCCNDPINQYRSLVIETITKQSKTKQHSAAGLCRFSHLLSPSASGSSAAGVFSMQKQRTRAPSANFIQFQLQFHSIFTPRSPISPFFNFQCCRICDLSLSLDTFTLQCIRLYVFSPSITPYQSHYSQPNLTLASQVLSSKSLCELASYINTHIHTYIHTIIHLHIHLLIKNISFFSCLQYYIIINII